MPVRKLQEFLDGEHIKYVRIQHSRAYTAQEIAASAHVSGQELAKTVIVQLDGVMKMAVLPASRKVDVEALRQRVGARQAELASEDEFRSRFPGCELGAMPPFGNLFDMEVLVESSLAEDDEIAFNAGSHTELVRVSWEDFRRLVNPRVLEFAI